jgi:hypothetical protein
MMAQGIEKEVMAGIREDVRGRYPHVPWHDVHFEPLFRGIGPKKVFVSDKQAVITRPVLYAEPERPEMMVGICSEKQYQLVPHEYAIHQMEQTMREFPQFGTPKISISLYDNGSKMVAEAEFPDCPRVIRTPYGRDDSLNPKAGIKNSYDGSWMWGYWFGAKVLRCLNGLMMWGKLLNGRSKHNMSLDVSAHMKAFGKGMEQLDTQFRIWEKWASKKLEAPVVTKFIEDLPISAKQREVILDLKEVGTNATLRPLLEKQKVVSGWFLGSVTTQWLTHAVNNTVSKVALEEMVSNTLHKTIENSERIAAELKAAAEAQVAVVPATV